MPNSLSLPNNFLARPSFFAIFSDILFIFRSSTIIGIVGVNFSPRQIFDKGFDSQRDFNFLFLSFDDPIESDFDIVRNDLLVGFILSKFFNESFFDLGVTGEAVLGDSSEFSELLDDESLCFVVIIGSNVFSPHVNNAPLLNSISNALIFPNFSMLHIIHLLFVHISTCCPTASAM